MGLLVASVSIVTTVLGFNRILKMKIWTSRKKESDETIINGPNQRLNQFGVRENIFSYIITTLLNQGEIDFDDTGL
jgi:hypothetical protein